MNRFVMPLKIEDAEDRADDRAATARQRGAADDGRGDRVEFVEVAVVGRAGGGQRDHHDGGDAAAQPGQRRRAASCAAAG